MFPGPGPGFGAQRKALGAANFLYTYMASICGFALMILKKS
jgi:hypothetical protein